VDGPRKHKRVSGSTIGGGTYWGLIRLLTDLEDFDAVLRLAERGDPTKVDMMVGDIYGNSDVVEKMGLSSDLVASSFGKLVAKDDPASGLKEEDLARALLLMITINIGQVAYLNAQLHKTSRIYFVGNFLRENKISQRRLSFAIDYWSKGEMEALFLEHEGYFGALGAFLLSQGISQAAFGSSRASIASTARDSPMPRLHKRSETIGSLSSR
jgi:type II pantothenate kinase